MKRKLSLILCTVLALCGCTAEDHNIEIKADQGEHSLSVECTLDAEGDSFTYEVSLKDTDHGRTITEFEIESSDVLWMNLSNRILYYLQENDLTSVNAELTVSEKEGKGKASVSFTLNDFLPADQIRRIGTDIPLQEIEYISLNSVSDTAELCYSYYFRKDNDEQWTASCSFCDEDTRREISGYIDNDTAAKILACLEGSELSRIYIEDPELQIMDGTDTNWTIKWKSMTSADEMFDLSVKQDVIDQICTIISEAEITEEE